MIRLVPAFALCLLVCTGCVSPVAFIAPCAPGPNPNSNSCQASAPVTQGAMAFASNFSPANSLTVSYGSQDITGLLTPPPAPNGTSTFPLPPPPNPNYYTASSETLTAAATCGFFCVYPTRTVTFTPLALSVGAVQTGVGPVAPLNVSKSQGPLLAFVTLPPTATATVLVTLTAAPAGVVAFATSPGGAGSPSLTLPVNGQASFYVQPLGPTLGFTATATAAGVQPGVQTGAVSN